MKTVNPAADMPLAPQEAPGKRAALVMAVVVHAVLLGFLIYGIRWQTQSPEAESVAVELVRAGPAAKAEPAPPQPKAEPEPPPPPPKPVVKAEPKPEPKAEPKAMAKPDIAVKEKEKPKAEPEKKSSLLKLLDNEFDRLNKNSKSAAVASALDKEIAQSKATQAAAANAKAVTDYMGRIRGKIRGNLILPPDVKGNPEASFDVVQLPSGEIISVKLRKSSGNAALDAAIERAILKSSPLPKPERGEIFSRDLDLKFRPLDD